MTWTMEYVRKDEISMTLEIKSVVLNEKRVNILECKSFASTNEITVILQLN